VNLVWCSSHWWKTENLVCRTMIKRHKVSEDKWEYEFLFGNNEDDIPQCLVCLQVLPYTENTTLTVTTSRNTEKSTKSTLDKYVMQ